MRSARRVDSARERKKHPLDDLETNADSESLHTPSASGTTSTIGSGSGSGSGGALSLSPSTPLSHKRTLESSSGGSGSKKHPSHHSNGAINMESISRMLTTTSSMLYSIKFLVLVILSLQNSLFTVLRRYSQGVLKETYSKYEVLMVGEIIKMIVSAYMIHRHMLETSTAVPVATTAAAAAAASSAAASKSTTTTSLLSTDGLDDRKTPPQSHTVELLLQRLRYLMQHSGKMAGLALIYGAMNILSFVALRNIGAGLFTIFAQCKIFTTALFSAILLNRKYSGNQWRALFALILGVLLFSESTWGDSSKLINDNADANTALGVAAVVTEVTLSGFASIYFEKVIKIDPMQMTIWERNYQLALGSVPVYIAFIIWSGGGEAGYMGGWTLVAWVVALLGAAGGLLVALSIKYGDAILKTLATTASIILSTLLEWQWMDGVLTPVMVIAGAQVVLAICNYTFDPTPPELLSSSSFNATAVGNMDKKAGLFKQSDHRSSVGSGKRDIEMNEMDSMAEDEDDDENTNEGIPLMQRQSQQR